MAAMIAFATVHWSLILQRHCLELAVTFMSPKSKYCSSKLLIFQLIAVVHRGKFCRFSFRWIYYCHSSKSTGKESGKTHLCAVNAFFAPTAALLSAIGRLFSCSSRLFGKIVTGYPICKSSAFLRRPQKFA